MAWERAPAVAWAVRVTTTVASERTSAVASERPPAEATENVSVRAYAIGGAGGCAGCVKTYARGGVKKAVSESARKYVG